MLSLQQLKALVDEMQSELVGGQIRRIDQPHAWNIVLEIENKGSLHLLLFSTHRHHARCHLITKRDLNPLSPPPFCQLLRAHLRYKKILSLEALEHDRIVRLRTAWQEGEAASEITLLAELKGSDSNLLLLNAEGKIFGTQYTSHRRSLSLGASYQATTIKPPLLPITEMPRLASLNASAEHFFRALEEKETRETAKRNLLFKYNHEIRKNHRRLSRLSTRLLEVQAASRFRNLGEILKMHLHEIEAGASQFQTSDPNDPDAKPVLIPLNPVLSPTENMAQLFKQYKRGERNIGAIQSAIKIVQKKIAQLDTEKVKAMTEEAVVNAASTAYPSAAKKKRKEEKAGPPRYRSADDIILIVGRDDLENTCVTFEIARGKDLWFHARGVPGAHLIVRMGRQKDLPHQSLLDAATLALHFSRSKEDGKGEVIYTQKKYLRKVKGGKQGAVLWTQEKTIHIAIEPQRLARVLGSRW